MRLTGTVLPTAAASVFLLACSLTTSLDGLTEGIEGVEAGAAGAPIEAGASGADASSPRGGAGGAVVGRAGAAGLGGTGGAAGSAGMQATAGRGPVDSGLGGSAPVEAAAPSCDDSIRNGRETDVDCGGRCSPCVEGLRCGRPSDCTTNDCRGGLCVDRTCTTTADCLSGVCASGWCGPETCTDGVVSGDETDQDCGGSCAPCAGTLGCEKDTDCQSNVCIDKACFVAFPG